MTTNNDGSDDNDDWERKCQFLKSQILNHDGKSQLSRDGSEETILAQIQRGSDFPSSRSKAWRHILIELEETRSSFPDNVCQEDYLTTPTSPKTAFDDDDAVVAKPSHPTKNKECDTVVVAAPIAIASSVPSSSSDAVGGGGATAGFALRAAAAARRCCDSARSSNVVERDDIDDGIITTEDFSSPSLPQENMNVTSKVAKVAFENNDDGAGSLRDEESIRRNDKMAVEEITGAATFDASNDSPPSSTVIIKPSTAPSSTTRTNSTDESKNTVTANSLSGPPRPVTQPATPTKNKSSSTGGSNSNNYRETIERLSSKKTLTMLERQNLWLAKKALKREEQAAAAQMAEASLMQSGPDISRSKKSYNVRQQKQQQQRRPQRAAAAAGGGTVNRVSGKENVTVIEGGRDGEGGVATDSGSDGGVAAATTTTQALTNITTSTFNTNRKSDSGGDRKSVTKRKGFKRTSAKRKSPKKKSSVSKTIEDTSGHDTNNQSLTIPRPPLTLPPLNGDDTKQITTTSTTIPTSSPIKTITIPPPTPTSASTTKKSFFTGVDADGRRPTLRVRDVSQFQFASLYRKRDLRSGLGTAVALLVGRDTSPPHDEKVIEVVFDTDKISEDQAREWWVDNEHRFSSPRIG